jgi:uncharacterized protein (UPF0254 family)
VGAGVFVGVTTAGVGIGAAGAVAEASVATLFSSAAKALLVPIANNINSKFAYLFDSHA